MRRITKHGVERRLRHYNNRLRQIAVNIIETGNPHGRLAKHPADFLNFLERQGGRQDEGFPAAWRVDDRLVIDKPARLAVVLNCYYTDLLPQLLERLTLIPIPFDLFVTNVSGQEVKIPTSLGNMNHSVVLDCANHGRDILPMVQLVNARLLDPYDLILKVHTKKSPWRADHAELSGSGEQWRDEFLDALLPSKERIEELITAFRQDPHLGVITAPGNIVGKEFWGGDQRIVEQLLRRIELSLDPDSLRFPAGSMYWCRGFVLQGLRAFNLIADDFDREAGQVDGTTAHAVERIIGIVAEEAGLSLATSDDIETAVDRDALSRLLDAYRPECAPTQRATVLPFYLPQFHPSPHNDRWWGTGFTEWHNVAGAIPAYEGHYQPKIPTDLGFYDLRLDEVRQAQADMAAAHGIAGFMYYYYWFSGERVLNLPIERLKDSSVDFPFCLMWANENWTRRWDGRSQDILIGQDYHRVPAEDFIDDIMEFLLDPRYIRVNGKAIIAVYRPGQMPDFGRVAAEWRRRAREAGAGELMILSVAVARDFGAIDAESRLEVDGTLEFPPHGLPWVAGPSWDAHLDSRYAGNFMSYQASAAASMRKAHVMNDDEYPGVMVTFDNTARRQWKPDIWYGSNPYTFRRWVASHLDALMTRPPESRIMFVNAWNEWAESAVLEPTTRFGMTYLLALRDAIRG
ncbi:glycoside hydrolase family 99-like domain-containing protein [Schaalia sp. Marseille-Q2122]|uniref:glycoside hydrolase family 99-like domain-containing protein n=1 Tax=Schaalia sp. Marseille-Q2122 TaxID=2736604 RepID=UPI00158B146B|nr:glycoside hydrolase family 99-like domain-containing protein [Schaalia sp. Marseille-Q2122]